MSVNSTYAGLGGRYEPGELRRQASGELCGVVGAVERGKVQHRSSWTGVQRKWCEPRSVEVVGFACWG